MRTEPARPAPPETTDSDDDRTKRTKLFESDPIEGVRELATAGLAALERGDMAEVKRALRKIASITTVGAKDQP